MAIVKIATRAASPLTTNDGPLLGLRLSHTLDMHGLDTLSLEPVVRDPSDRPELALLRIVSPIVGMARRVKA